MPHFLITRKGLKKQFVFPDADMFTIGRARGNDIVLPDPDFKVSRLHAVIIRMRGPERYFIRDLSSVHGTRIRGALVNQCVLQDGDVVQIAEYSLSYLDRTAPLPNPQRLRLGMQTRSHSTPRSNTRIMTRDVLAGEAPLGPDKKGALAELLQRTSRIFDVNELFRELLYGVLAVVGANRGFAAVFHAAGNLYDEIAVARMNPGEQIELSDESALDRLLEGEIFQEGSIALVPLVVDEEVKGFICVDRPRRAGPLSDQDAGFLHSAGLLAAAHLGNGVATPVSSEIHDEPIPWPFEIVGKSEAMQSVLRAVREAASTGMNTLITGESGTGKELIARAIHDASGCRGDAFVARNCASIAETLAVTEIFGHAPQSGIYGANPRGSPGWFELANGGTLLLDEIQALSLPVQDQFLRVLQEQEVLRVGARTPVHVNVKVIAATDRNLEEAIGHGQFRQALYYRFGKKILVPPLRDRRDDIPLLVHSFLDLYSATLGTRTRCFSHRASQLLVNFDWPGNVRELKDCIRAAAGSGKEVLLSWDFDSKLSRQPAAAEAASSFAPRKMVAQAEKEQIMEALEATKGNISRAQVLLGYKSRQTMLNKMDEYGIPRTHGDQA